MSHGEHEGGERAQGHEQILAEGRLADGLGDDRMEGEDKRGQQRGENLLRPAFGGGHLPDHQPDEQHVCHVHEHAGEVVPERVPAPDRRVEHERGQHGGPVEVEHVHPEHATGQHGRPVPPVVDEVAREDLHPGVVDEGR